MRAFLTALAVVSLTLYTQAQDPGMQAAQQAQMAAHISQQATQQAMQNAQLASQNATAAQQRAMSTQLERCGAPTPSFSVKTGAYSSPITVTITASRKTAVYYTLDGWTPTKASPRYLSPITIDSTTTLQAVAFAPCDGRSRVATAVYTLTTGVSSAPAAGQSVTVLHGLAPTISNAAAAAAASGKLLLAHGTPVPLVFTSEITSKTAHVGDQISLILAQDLKAGDTVVAAKGTSSTATITQVQKPRAMGRPGEIIFQADSLQADGTVIKLHGTAAKEGQDAVNEAAALMVIPVPVGLFVHGKDAEIKQGAVFTAFVDVDTVLPRN
jgi:hypothetical protein